MSSPESRPESSKPSATSAQLLAQLTTGYTLQCITYVTNLVAGQSPLVKLPLGCFAIEDAPTSQQKLSPAGTLTLLLVPASLNDVAPSSDSPDLTIMRRWVETTPAGEAPETSHLMTFQSAQICWAPGRCAILASKDRLPGLMQAAIEVNYLDAELRSVETKLADTWPQLEADMPLAFEFQEASVATRKQLRQRFQQVLELRARLARLGTYVNAPHKHPPTLATQISERLRERTQMMHRYEYVDEELAVFEEVYEMCGQRASDFMLTRSGNTLEWIIIILLSFQILLSGFEMLSTEAEAPVTATTTAPATVPASETSEAEPSASESSSSEAVQ